MPYEMAFMHLSVSAASERMKKPSAPLSLMPGNVPE